MSKRDLAGLSYGFLGAEAHEETTRPRKRNRASYLEVPVDQDADFTENLTVAATIGEHTPLVKSQKKVRAPPGRTAATMTARSESLVVRLSISPGALSDLLKRLAIPHVEPDVSGGAEIFEESDEEMARTFVPMNISGKREKINPHKLEHEARVLESDSESGSSSPLSSARSEFYSKESETDATTGAEDLQSNLELFPAADKTCPLASTAIRTHDSAELLEKLERIWHAMKQLSLITPKPQPIGQPSVWADGEIARTDMCEALPYYRSFKGSFYPLDGFACAFMHDAAAGPRDFMDSNVIFSHASGGLTEQDNQEQASADSPVKKSRAGPRRMSRKGNQPDSREQLLLRKNLEMGVPIAIITGNKNPTAQFAVPHRYCVLGWFMITDIWYEKVNGVGEYRYRFEKLPTATPSWWKPQGVDEPVQLGELGDSNRQSCSTCGKSCDQVYLIGWMCTNRECAAWWTLEDGTEPDEGSLQGDPRFAKKKTIFPQVSPPFMTKPNPWIFGRGHGYDAGIVWEATRGIVCPDCGRCGVREEWSRWTCQNSACGLTRQLPLSLVEPRQVLDYWHPVDEGVVSFRQDDAKNCGVEESIKGNWRVTTYRIPGTDCSVVHMFANKTIHEESGGPNDMFKNLQQEDIGLKRRRIGGDGMTNNFTKNFGMPYKFIVGTASESFDTAPKAIHDARARMNWAARESFGEATHEPFNECLVLGYFEDNSIKYHDDGEKGLGPTIATLSLGGSAKMTLRMKQTHFKGCTQGSGFVDREPITGCENHGKRLAAWKTLEKLNLDPKERKTRLKKMAQELGLKPGAATGGGPVVLEMKINYGDIVLMNGRVLQEVFEHQVKPLGKLRYAITGRSIEEGSLKVGDRPDYEVRDEAVRYDGYALRPPITRE
ncbi:Nucleoporin [Venturia inaequalis]|nr:Nucleoporin [Venturia inaequalis]